MPGQASLPSSFRDPAGFLFRKQGTLYRQINQSNSSDYDTLMSSGLYSALVKAKLLIPHQEVDLELAGDRNAYKVIQPEPVGYISYPYEWCFSQLKDAALATMTLQRVALKFGMSLKDSSAYNIQFHRGSPVLIDTLSFTEYREGEPWIAYRQFCQHFMAPLALMSYTDVRLPQLFRVFIDGLPLDLTSKLLPMKTYLKYPLLTHIHLHARAQSRYASTASGTAKKPAAGKISRKALSALLLGIHNAIKKMNWTAPATEWAEYYSATNYQDQAMQHKQRLVEEFLSECDATETPVQDLGANNGHFSRIATRLGFNVVSQDIDPVAVENNYLLSKQNKETNILPLLLDLTNPVAAIGWASQERMSFTERAAASTVMALALIHHLAISNNVPLPLLAEFFNGIASRLIIEFVPKTDSQVQRLLSGRKDIFTDYTQAEFENAFSKHFNIVKQTDIDGSERTLYLMQRITETAK